jgi:uncharacterized membrane protein YraQ (UPF0718 family)
MDGELARLESTFVEFLPNLLAALAVLVVGWLIALAIAALVKKLLQKTQVDDRVAAWVSPDPKTAVTKTAIPSPTSTSVSATPAIRLTRARRGSGPGVALTPGT